MYDDTITLNIEKVPKHIALIMDGNGRWAIKRGLDRSAGHKKGADRIKDIIYASNKLGIKVITVFAFSTENWNRSKKEVNYIFRLLENMLDDNLKEFNKNNIKIRTIGLLNKFETEYPSLYNKIINAVDTTKDNNGIILNIALNYGSHNEIIEGIKKLYVDINKGRLKIEDLTDNIFENYLMTAGLPSIDLMIRTSGEQRLSNFLLWQLAYTELVFTSTCWPDFDEYELKKCIYEYQLRDRRYGKIK